MPTPIITPKTAAELSSPFRVHVGHTPRGISAVGLAGAEVMTVYRDRGDGVFEALTDASATMSLATPTTSIVVNGTYKINKPITAGAAGCYLD